MADLAGLEKELSTLSHTEDVLNRIQRFSEQLRNTANRIQVFNGNKALVRSPISRDAARALGFDRQEDTFTLLQAMSSQLNPRFFSVSG